MRALPYVPVEELEGRPHVIVDGSLRPGTVLTLSHWPQSLTSPELARDLSAEIVFAFLQAARGQKDSTATRGRIGWRSAVNLVATIARADRAEAVSNDHFDEDGLVSVLAMTDPEFALGHEGLLTDVASCGDFGVVKSSEAARIAFAIANMGEEATKAPRISVERPGSMSGPSYWAVLDRAAELVEHPDRFQTYWQDQDAALADTQADIESGAITIDEVPEVDLAIVRRAYGVRRSGLDTTTAVPSPIRPHEVAIHSATLASRILAFNKGRCELYLRYEGWVRYVSRKVPLRPDLEPLAEQLSVAEPSGSRWVADGVGSLVSRMHPVSDGRTELDPKLVVQMVVEYLKRAPGAWDPFRKGGALIPLAERRPPR